jgi:C-terminal processing protease CtpA/Prc
LCATQSELAGSLAETDDAFEELDRVSRELMSAIGAVKEMYGAVMGKEDPSEGGLGIKISSPFDGGQIRVNEIIRGGPAALRNKFSVDDVLLSVNGQPVSGKSVEDLRSLIVGPSGTPVTLKAQRHKDGGRFMVMLPRTTNLSGDPWILAKQKQEACEAAQVRSCHGAVFPCVVVLGCPMLFT